MGKRESARLAERIRSFRQNNDVSPKIFPDWMVLGFHEPKATGGPGKSLARGERRRKVREDNRYEADMDRHRRNTERLKALRDARAKRKKPEKADAEAA